MQRGAGEAGVKVVFLLLGADPQAWSSGATITWTAGRGGVSPGIPSAGSPSLRRCFVAAPWGKFCCVVLGLDSFLKAKLRVGSSGGSRDLLLIGLPSLERKPLIF